MVDQNNVSAAAHSSATQAASGVSLLALVLALTSGHAIASMALLVLPAVAPAAARDYGIDASLIGYQLSIVSVGLLFSLMSVGNLSQKLGGCRTNQLGHAMVVVGMLLMLMPAVAFVVPGSLAGAYVYIIANVAPDGALNARSVTVSKDGVRPGQ